MLVRISLLRLVDITVTSVQSFEFLSEIRRPPWVNSKILIRSQNPAKVYSALPSTLLCDLLFGFC